MLRSFPTGRRGPGLAAAGIATVLSLLPPQASAAPGGPLDVDGNGVTDGLTDGLLLLRYMLGIRGNPLIIGALAPNATRTTSTAIENYIVALLNGSAPGTGNGPPSACSVAQYPNTAAQAVAAGTMIDLAVQCGGGFPPMSCSWNNGIASTACAIRIPAPAATTTFTAVPANSFGTGAPVSTLVNIGSSSSQSFCTGSDVVQNFSWPAAGQVRLATFGFSSQVWAFRLVVPSTFSPPLDINHLGFVHMAETPGAPNTPREYTVSKNACDFQSGVYVYSGIGNAISSPAVNFTTNNPGGYIAAGADFNINSGDIIYFNVRNSTNGVPACSMPPCDLSFDFATPNRY